MPSIFVHLFLTVICTAVVSALPAGRSGASKPSYDVHLTRDPTYGMLAKISMGSPPQQITALFDWTWISMYSLTTTCKGRVDNAANCFSPTQAIFNQSASSTFRNESSLYPSRTWNPNVFLGNIDWTVDYASDMQTVGPTTARIVVQAGDFQADVSPTVFPFTGIFGLSPVFSSDNASTQSPFYQMWKQGAWPTPFASFINCYGGSKVLCNGYDGLQTLGGYNPAVIRGKLTWYDVIKFPEVNNVDFHFGPAIINYWAASLTQLSLGDEIQALNQSLSTSAAIFDYASQGRGAPLSVNAYKSLVSMSGATAVNLTAPPNNGQQAFYQVDCDKQQSLPPIKYRFAGNQRIWEILAEDYVANLGGGLCVLDVRTIGDGDFIAGNFGETFLKNKYIVFDFQRLRIGLADLK